MPPSALTASAAGASYLILLQISTRALTFALNQLLLRRLSPTILGLSVQLEIFKIGIQYFSRESLRVAAERRSDGGIQASINLSYLAIIANLPLGFVFGRWYMRFGDRADVAYFEEALLVCQFAAFVELCMEPAFTAVQHNMLYKARAAAEGSSAVTKTITVFALFYWADRNLISIGVLPFAMGELVNSVTLTAVYWVWTIPLARSYGFSLFPRRMKSRCVLQYYLQSVSSSTLILSHIVLKSNTSSLSSPNLSSGSLAACSFRQASNGCSQRATSSSSLPLLRFRTRGCMHYQPTTVA